MENNYVIKPLDLDQNSLEQVAQLLKKSFPLEEKYSLSFLNWQYNENPDGKVIGFNAFLNDELVAHYVCIPQKWKYQNKVFKTLLSLNTATHPNHQGKGLFTQLANATYNEAKKENYCFVLGVANQNSFPGFINKLNFLHLCTLDARIGFYKATNNSHSEFHRLLNDENIKWRINHKESNYFQFNNCVFSKTAKAMIDALMLFNENPILKSLRQQNPSRLKLIIGTNENLKQYSGTGINLPAFARPAPLHLIVKKLQLEAESLNYNSISFGLFDFDAY